MKNFGVTFILCNSTKIGSLAQGLYAEARFITLLSCYTILFWQSIKYIYMYTYICFRGYIMP